MCGFHWHATRMTRVGTDHIFNLSQSKFQTIATGGKIDWDNCKELLFDLKKYLDHKYRNMMYHFCLGGVCERCIYWDEVYTKHQLRESNKNAHVVAPLDVTDEEMLSAVESMEVDGTD